MMSQSTQAVEQHHDEYANYVVLLPYIEPDDAARLIHVASAIALAHHGSVLLLKVIVVPEGQPLSNGVTEARRVRAELDQAIAASGPTDAPIRPLVTVAYALNAGMHTAASEHNASLLLLGWHEESSSSERLFGPPIEEVLRRPPCDVAVVRLHGNTSWRRVLLPVRGGPHTPLACDMALALSETADAEITVLYASDPRRADDVAARESLQSLRTMPRVSRWLERAISAEQAILAEAPNHQLVVLGVSGRRTDPEAPSGVLAERVLRYTNSTVVLVRHRMEQAEEHAQQVWQRQRDLSDMVDRWFAENTFNSAEFDDIRRLLALKQQQGVTISLALPALNEEETVGDIIRATRQALMEDVPLLDEIVLIDSGSDDRTREIARDHNIPVYIHQNILPQYGAFTGKGEALWKSLHVLKSDIIAWIDTDIRNFHPRFVYGILGPLLREPRLMYCKGFYRRPIRHGDTVAAAGGGRVTELTARPLFNLFFPELSGMVQPLAGEYAVRRSAIEQVPFFTGYGVETGLLIDLLENYGLQALAQVDLEQRIHRNQELLPLSKMAFAIIQVVMQRLEQRQRVHLLEPINQSMKLIRHAEDDGFHLEVRQISDHERPPMASIPEYRRARGLEG
jgi:glucosyl-3-phosphoglycerate synthase